MILLKNRFSIFKAVIKALFYREIKTRFGNHFLGYFFALFEPVAHVLLLSLIFLVIGKQSINQIDFIYFVGISILSWLLFINTFSKTSNALEANSGFFHYKQVKIFDVFIVRVFIEFILFFFSFIFFEILILIFNEKLFITNFFLLFLYSGFLSLLGFSFGSFFAFLYNFFPNLKKVVNIILRILYFSSGIFYTIDKIPSSYHFLFEYNPIFLLISNIRYCYFGDLYFHNFNFHNFYILFLSLFLFFLSLFFIQIFEKKILRG